MKLHLQYTCMLMTQNYIVKLNLLMTTKFYRMIYLSCAYGLRNGY